MEEIRTRVEKVETRVDELERVATASIKPKPTYRYRDIPEDHHRYFVQVLIDSLK